MNIHNDTPVDVVICGLGPTGLSLAHVLGRRGLQVLVLEREPSFYGNARAVYTDGECMRLFQSIGMAERLAQDMIQDAAVQMLLPDGRVLLQLKTAKRPYGWPTHNFFYQPKLETALADGLAAYPNVRVLRGREVCHFEQDADGVTVRHMPSLATGYQRNKADAAPPAEAVRDGVTVRGRYLVGCDGGRSMVRTQLGIGMQGKNFPNPWLVVDIRLKDPSDGLRHLPNFSFVCDPSCPTVSCLQPDGHHRFEFMLMPGQSREYMEDPATVRQYLSRWIDVDKFEVLRVLVYTFNALMAERWREGRVLLAGDAAHMTPQFIGQGMNAGVRDAFNLGWKLDAVIKGVAADSLLDSYQRERRPHAAAMTREGVRMKDYVSMVHPLATMLRNGLTRLAMATPGLRDYITEARFIPQARYVAGQHFGLARGWRGGSGRMLPQPDVRGPDGKRHRLDDFLGAGFALIGVGVDPRQSLDEAQLAQWQRLDTRFIAVYPLGAKPQGSVARQTPAGLLEVEDLDGKLLAWLRATGFGQGSVTMVRPDRFVCGQAAPDELPAATATLMRALGQSPIYPQSSRQGKQHAYSYH
jgi:3-(3-hydroxy-phenyl)propionate hydroxylase